MSPFTSDRVNKAVEDCERFIADKDDAWSLSRAAATFIYQIAILHGAKNMLEIGTSYGHSGLFLADSARRNSGRLTTVEKDPRKVTIARNYFAQAGLDDLATVLAGVAPDVLTTAPDRIDFLFIDATKPEQDAYLDLLWPKLAVPAVIITDNAGNHKDQMVGFLKRLRTDDRLLSNFVPIGNGMELTLRLR